MGNTSGIWKILTDEKYIMQKVRNRYNTIFAFNSDKEDFLQAIKSDKPTIESLEAAHCTISMCQLGQISIKAELVS